MNTFSDRLKNEIERHAGGVVRTFARAIGSNHQAVHNWLNEERWPSASALMQMWHVYKIDPLWLLTGEKQKRGPVHLGVSPPPTPANGREAADREVADFVAEEIRRDHWLPAFALTSGAADFVAEEIRRDRFVTVPLLADAIAGGRPRAIKTTDIEDYVVIHADWCPNPEETTCVRVRGDSMSPILTEGSIVAIDHHRVDPAALDGKMAAFRQGDGASIKWCKVVSNELVMGLPENKEFTTEDDLLMFRGKEVDNCVIGAVLWWWGRQVFK